MKTIRNVTHGTRWNSLKNHGHSVKVFFFSPCSSLTKSFCSIISILFKFRCLFNIRVCCLLFASSLSSKFRGFLSLTIKMYGYENPTYDDLDDVSFASCMLSHKSSSDISVPVPDPTFLWPTWLVTSRTAVTSDHRPQKWAVYCMIWYMEYCASDSDMGQGWTHPRALAGQ